jgi:hypothetical protein
MGLTLNSKAEMPKKGCPRLSCPRLSCPKAELPKAGLPKAQLAFSAFLGNPHPMTYTLPKSTKNAENYANVDFSIHKCEKQRNANKQC